MPELLYLNGSFDLRLAGSPTGRYHRFFQEMTAWFLLIGSADDRIVLECGVPDDTVEFLRSIGLDPPRRLAAGEKAAGYRGVPWGWDRQALDAFRDCGAAIDHPPVDVVAEVNSRVFCHGLARRQGLGVRPSLLCHSPGEAMDALRVIGRFPCVLKPQFGNTGLGFVFVESADDPRIRRAFPREGCVVIVEPWLRRIADVSSRFDLRKDGAVTGLRHYTTQVTPKGAFFGMLCAPNDPVAAPWAARLDNAAAFAAEALQAHGYFGPVSVGAMVVEKPGLPSPPGPARYDLPTDVDTCELVPLLEINARQSMSGIAFSLAGRLAPDGCCLLRTAGDRSHTLPATYPQWRAMLGGLAYDPATRTGVVCATPLRMADTGKQPLRSIFLVAARTPGELVEIEARALEKIQRR